MPAHADRADDLTPTIAHEYPSRHGDQVAVSQRDERVGKVGTALGLSGKRSAADPHVQCAVGLAPGNSLPQQAGAVLAGERDEIASGVEDRNGHWRKVSFSCVLEGTIHDDACIDERDH